MICMYMYIYTYIDKGHTLLFCSLPQNSLSLYVYIPIYIHIYFDNIQYIYVCVYMYHVYIHREGTYVFFFPSPSHTVRALCVCLCVCRRCESICGIDRSVCLLSLKHLVSLQAHTSPSFQDEIDLHTASDKLKKKKKKEMLYLFPQTSPLKETSCNRFFFPRHYRGGVCIYSL